MICGKCGVSLPEGSQYCFKCGEPVAAAASPSAVETAAACSCGSVLPPGSQFCPKCGQIVVGAFSPWRLPIRRTKKRHGPVRVLSLILVAMLLWISFSDSPEAQQVRRTLSVSHMETLTPELFFVNSKGFSSYKFYVPPGTREATISGRFDANGGAHHDIEIYVLSEPDEVNWQSGYAHGGFYDSGRVSQGEISVSLPKGVGAYCLVFDNTFSPSDKKMIHANVTLSYSRWWPAL